MSNATHVNGSCHVWMSHCHLWMSHVTHVIESCHTLKCVTSHIWRNHVTYANESCHTFEWVMSHTWSIRMRKVACWFTRSNTRTWNTQINESCPKNERDMSHNEWDTSHIRMRKAACRFTRSNTGTWNTQINASYHVRMVVLHVWMSHVAYRFTCSNTRAQKPAHVLHRNMRSDFPFHRYQIDQR